METQTQQDIRFGVKIKGYLACDNAYWDCKCPDCGGSFSSYVVGSICPACQHNLGNIMTTTGEKMCISEGTIYPIQTHGEKEHYAAQMVKMGAVPIHYRFKMFNYADLSETLTPPAEHMHCKKGSLVAFVTHNHLTFAIPFTGKGGGTQIELLHLIMPKYNDQIKVIKSTGQIATAMDVNEPYEVPVDKALSAADISTLIESTRNNLAALEKHVLQVDEHEKARKAEKEVVGTDGEQLDFLQTIAAADDEPPEMEE